MGKRGEKLLEGCTPFSLQSSPRLEEKREKGEPVLYKASFIRSLGQRTVTHALRT